MFTLPPLILKTALPGMERMQFQQFLQFLQFPGAPPRKCRRWARQRARLRCVPAP